jgi:hypothetical protein
MSEFKIKNLMIDVVSGVQVPDLDKLCLRPTKLPGCWFPRSCMRFISPCGIWTPCPIRSIDPCHFMRTTILECIGESMGCAGSDLPIACGGTELVVIDLGKLLVNPELINEVRAELDEVLKIASERGVQLTKALAPQTKAQAELLETELKAALEEVQKLKGNLK